MRPLMYFQQFGAHPFIGYRQLKRNTVFPGYAPEDSNWIISVSEDGITMNGDCGINPTAVEVHELALILVDCVEAWKTIAPEYDQT